ncbi:MAG: hypothetical protein Q8844_01370 [Pigeon pea little leaf phytoplasma]|uniref:hypothetical protein n=1 Tax=Candidatus Phytoplasma stylosanthis TaxID=2798314 RepID=UPI00293A25A2|nr:hypothetical protein [Candidatus Phytoplasma stylosanthis]MDV3163456.1 hypothetical protein [Pigeon pea little leaf phytoplasma]MDV3168221.1 hypothetical protein [Candidatus Phytoplasma stylosanthis]MDV3189014.1 hypothetical protein [Pigeon pea little leaf phytoplasma]
MFWFKNKKRIFILFFLTVSLLIVIPFYLMKKDHNNPPSETYNIPSQEQLQEEKIKKPNYLSKLKYFPKKLVFFKKPIHRLIKFSTKTASLMASLIAIILACH